MDANLVFTQLGDLVVAVHGRGTPTEDEWERYLGYDPAPGDPEVTRVLVLTYGGKPSPRLRSVLNSVRKRRRVRVAVVTDLAPIRAVVTGMSLFNPDIRAFRRAELDSAFAYLQVAEEHVEGALAELGRLSALVV